jgi:FKBP-type peptidyl-prolyl cis-trans isomerase SlyD
VAISNNQVVSMKYELRVTGQSDIIDSNLDQAPLEFIIGKGHIIPGLERELLKLSQGDKEVISVKAKDAYGERADDAVDNLPVEQFAGIDLEEGLQLYGQGEDGQSIMVTVVEFSDKEVKVDYNHPLAGKDLTFDIEISGVRDATPDEVNSGVIGSKEHSCGCGEGGCKS